MKNGPDTLLRAALVLFSSSIVLAAANMLRVVLLSRLLSLEDFGVAATFNILANALSMAFGFGLGQFLIQAPEGDNSRFQAALQGLQASYGVFLFGLLLIFAGSYGELMNVPDAAWAYRILAILALFIGFIHFDIFRQQRHNNFVSLSLFNTVPMIISLLSIWPLFIFFGDWRVMPFALLLQGGASVLISHLRGTRSYSMAFDPNYFKQGMRFGAPLFGNAVLLFVIFSGDRIVVSNQFGLKELAWFSAAFMLTLMPVNMLVRNLQSMLLPRLSNQASNPIRMADLVLVSCQAFAWVGALVAVFFALCGEPLLLLLFGPDYVMAAEILTLLGVMQGLRCLRAAPNVLAMAVAKTEVIFYVSLLRAAFIPLGAVLIFTLDWSLSVLILLGIFGELTAMLFAFALLQRVHHIPLVPLSVSLAGVALTILSILVLEFTTQPVALAVWLPINLWALFPTFLVLLSIVPMGSLRREIVKRIDRAK